MVAVVDDSGTVGNEDDGLLVLRQQVLEQLSFGVRVQCTGGLVENHDGTSAQQGTGDGDALSLSFRQSAPLFAARRVHSFFQFHDEVGAGRMQGLPHVVVRCLGVAQQQVVADGAAEQRVALRHIDEVAAVEWGDVLLVLCVIDGYLSLRRSDQCQQQSHEGGLAGSRLTEDGGAGARLEVESQVADDIAAAVQIVVGHVVQP